MARDAEAATPRPKAVDDEVSRPAEFIAKVRFGFEHGHGGRAPWHDASRGRHGQKLLLPRGGSLIDGLENRLAAFDGPVSRHLAQPRQDRLLVFRIRLEGSA